MPISDAERAAADYLLTIPAGEERSQAAARISQLVKAKTPAADAKIPTPVTRFRDYREKEFIVPPFLLPSGQLVRGELHALIARAGKGKTTLMMNRIIRWAAGKPLFEERAVDQTPIEGPMKIVMLQNEGVAGFMQEKLIGLADSMGEESSEAVDENLYIWGDGAYSNFKVDREGDIAILRRALEETKPDLVTLEPFRKLWTGEENDNTAMEAVLESLLEVAAEYQVAIMIGHHERKSGAGEDGEEMSRSRGAGAFESGVAVMENLKSVKNGEYTELTWSKRRYSTDLIPLLRMQFNHATWQLEYVPEDQLKDEIITLMDQDSSSWYTRSEIAEALEETETKINPRLEQLAEPVDGQRIVKKKGDRGSWKYRLKIDGMSDNNGGLDV